MVKKQIKNIEYTIDLIKKKNKQGFDEKWLNDNHKLILNNSITWCIENNIPYELKNKY